MIVFFYFLIFLICVLFLRMKDVVVGINLFLLLKICDIFVILELKFKGIEWGWLFVN